MKSKLVIMTDRRILVATPNKKQVRFINQYGDLHGVTKSLRIGANNVILHFGTRADEEWFCDKREEMINILVQQHQALENRPLQVFGLSSPSLDDYLTSERDLARKISRMPG